MNTRRVRPSRLAQILSFQLISEKHVWVLNLACAVALGVGSSLELNAGFWVLGVAFGLAALRLLYLGIHAGRRHKAELTRDAEFPAAMFADHCVRCGHDLRGSRLHCPECGAWHGRRQVRSPSR